jgi:hypothetical protein
MPNAKVTWSHSQGQAPLAIPLPKIFQLCLPRCLQTTLVARLRDTVVQREACKPD